MEKERARAQPGWSAFLWSYIYEVSDRVLDGDYEGALRVLRSLMDFLPRNVKEEMKREVEEINRMLAVFAEVDRRALRSRGSITPFDVMCAFYNARIAKNMLARRMVMEVVRRLVNILDEKGYLEVRVASQSSIEVR